MRTLRTLLYLMTVKCGGRTRLRILLWALTLGALCGAIDFGQPAEDAFRAVRDQVHLHAADKAVTVVLVDDRTLNAMRGNDTPRSADAKVIDYLFQHGAKRVFFDRAFADPTNAHDDQMLAATMRAHRGKVFIGVLPHQSNDLRGAEAIEPMPLFLAAATPLSLKGTSRPFNLTFALPFRSETKFGVLPSLSARLAHLDSLPSQHYQPDFSIDMRTVPTLSYIDLFHQKTDDRLIAGKDIVFGPSATTLFDRHYIPFRGQQPGVYVHVIGAETIKHGLPTEIGWVIPFLVAAIGMILLVASGRTVRIASIIGMICGVALAALVFDLLHMMVTVVPALLTCAITMARLRVSQAVKSAHDTNEKTGIPHIATLRASRTMPDHHVVALKIQNFSAIAAAFGDHIEPVMIQELVRRILLIDPTIRFAHTQDILVFLARPPAASPVEDHIRGLHSILTNGLVLEGRSVDVSICFGVDTLTGRTVTQRLDSAVQCAENAAAQHQILSIARDWEESERQWQLQIVSSVDTAMANGELRVAYQPKIDVASRCITGAEALVRWNHPLRGAIDPTEFIPVLEANNRIGALTDFVLQHALRFAATHIETQPDFTVSVNVSGQLLGSPYLTQLVTDALARCGVAAHHLVLEITETAPLEHDVSCQRTLAELRRIGAQLSIDDFGTGNATIDYLRNIPGEEVKLDKSFVGHIDAREEDRQIVRSVIDMAHSLGRRVVAEGVENEAIFEILKTMGCDQAQGYLFAPALSPLEFELCASALKRAAA